jgi:hypothetical protein
VRVTHERRKMPKGALPRGGGIHSSGREKKRHDGTQKDGRKQAREKGGGSGNVKECADGSPMPPRTASNAGSSGAKCAA